METYNHILHIKITAAKVTTTVYGGEPYCTTLLRLRIDRYSVLEKSCQLIIGIDTNIEVIVVSLTTWEAHHSPRAKPEGCGELPRSLMRQQ